MTGTRTGSGRLVPDWLTNLSFVAVMIAFAWFIVNIWLWRHEERWRRDKRERDRAKRSRNLKD
jgi:ABC-type transport system involved in Fe-S cluster assembly fused permease/ATPase subunit